ncbi:MAG: MarR family transcriptional regulator, transcriptional regulator for hemolysin [Pseudonocardiales bacterium]|jgi:DNA-binding MarR family transcriptional regulator|nr:MarR family transcriptional regulator, transcriptional regulator for hemolysin [Pseudonocardiales bacterium]
MRVMGVRQPAASELAATPCSALFRPADLTFLLHAAADRMAADLDRAAVDMGLNDVRDWLVLAALDDGQQRTQLELSRMVCVDKTTLISVLDRLEQHELVVRTVDPADRRVRIPQITPAGRRVYAKFASARDTAEARALDGVEPEQRTLLLELLARIADRQDAAAQDLTRAGR